MKATMVSIVLSAIVGNAWADCNRQVARDGQSPVPVFVVTTSPEGFTQTKQLADSTRDLVKSLKGKKGICLAEKREDALVTVEVLGREKAQQTATWSGTGRDVTVSARLTAGTFETVISESAAGGAVMAGGAWGKAAGKVAKRIEEWVRDNRAKLTEAKASS
jgi:hypothetical protein